MKTKYTFDELDHIHLLDGMPLYGTTTVLSIIAKPLTWWASGLAVKELSGIEDPSVFTRIKNKKATKDELANIRTAITKYMTENKEHYSNIDVDWYLAFLDKAYRAHSVKLASSAEKGIDLHSELERFVKNEMAGIKATDYDVKIAPFINWTIANVKRFLWSEGHCYSEKHWIGGISDAGAELNDNSLIIIDFKSSKSAYASYFLQVGAYDIAISENGLLDKEGNVMYKPDKSFNQYVIIPFGSKIVEPAFIPNPFNKSYNELVDGCKEGFLASLALYKQLQSMEE